MNSPQTFYAFKRSWSTLPHIVKARKVKAHTTFTITIPFTRNLAFFFSMFKWTPVFAKAKAGGPDAAKVQQGIDMVVKAAIHHIQENCPAVQWLKDHEVQHTVIFKQTFIKTKTYQLQIPDHAQALLFKLAWMGRQA